MENLKRENGEIKERNSNKNNNLFNSMDNFEGETVIELQEVII